MPLHENSTTDPLIGGGDAFNELLTVLLGLLSEQRAGAASVGQDLVSQFMGLNAEARAAPIGLVDRLALAGEVGSLLPLSQGGEETLSRFTTRPNNSMLEDLVNQLAGFASNQLPRAQLINISQTDVGLIAAARLPDGTIEYFSVPKQSEGLITIQGNTGPFSINASQIQSFLFNSGLGDFAQAQVTPPAPAVPENPVPLTDILGAKAGGDVGLAEALSGMLNQPQLANARPAVSPQQRSTALVGTSSRPVSTSTGKLNLPFNFKHGGELLIDPRQRTSEGTSIAGPVSMVDSTGKLIAKAGEGGAAELLSVAPITGGASPTPTRSSSPARFGSGGTGPGKEIPSTLVLTRSEQFRLQDIRTRYPEMEMAQAIKFAKNPAELDRFLGIETEGRTTAARLLGGAVSEDLRLTDPFVRALSLGRSPSPAELTMRDVRSLSPDASGGLQSVIGSDLLAQFFFELFGFTPDGLQARGATVGGVNV